MITLALDCTNSKLESVIRLLKILLQLIQIVVPIGLIVLGSLDLAKGVIAADESDIKKNQKVFLKRLIAAVLVFFVSIIVGIVMGLVGNDAWQECWYAVSSEQTITCEYVLSGQGSFTLKYSKKTPEQYSLITNDVFKSCTISKPTSIKGYAATGKCPEKIGFYFNYGNCELNAKQPSGSGPMFKGTYNLKK